MTTTDNIKKIGDKTLQFTGKQDMFACDKAFMDFLYMLLDKGLSPCYIEIIAWRGEKK